MNETVVQDASKERLKDKVRQRRPRLNELAECKVWLESLGFQSPPKIHINGVHYASAVVVVDFGTPLIEPGKLTSEQSSDLIGHIRVVTKSLYTTGDINVRVQNDASAGIWWSSVG